MRPAIALCLLSGPAFALDFFVSPEGNDNFIGTTADRPLASLAVARDRVRASGRVGKEQVNVWLEDGVYRLDETWVLRAEDGGENGFPVAYRARHRGQAVLTGERLPCLVSFEGGPGGPVAWLRLEGLTLRRSAPPVGTPEEPLLRSGVKFRRSAALRFTGAEDCVVEDCTFEQLEGNAVLATGHNRRLILRGAHLRDISGYGLCFVGETKAVRQPLFQPNATPDYRRLDRTPGPASTDYPQDCVVEDCLIQGCGRREPAGGVLLAMSAAITLRQLTIAGCTGPGILLCDGAWGGHLVEGCDVQDASGVPDGSTGLLALGRDRYWDADRSVVEREVAAAPGLPRLDAERPTTIRFSRWRSERGPDLTLGEGTTGYLLDHNVFLRGGVRLEQGYERHLENNVFINGGLRLHAGFDRSGDVFRRNLVDGMTTATAMDRPWGERFDENLYRSPAQLKAAQAGGRERHSLAGPPGYLDPGRGDFRVGADSPALRVGFENFPMAAFGVRSDHLRRLADQPRIDLPAPAQAGR
jgi:hypothetical protein